MPIILFLCLQISAAVGFHAVNSIANPLPGEPGTERHSQARQPVGGTPWNERDEPIRHMGTTPHPRSHNQTLRIAQHGIGLARRDCVVHGGALAIARSLTVAPHSFTVNQICSSYSIGLGRNSIAFNSSSARRFREPESI